MDVLDLAPYEEVCRTTPQCEGHETDGPGALHLGWLKSREELHEVQFLESIGQKKKTKEKQQQQKIIGYSNCIYASSSKNVYLISVGNTFHYLVQPWNTMLLLLADYCSPSPPNYYLSRCLHE